MVSPFRSTSIYSEHISCIVITVTHKHWYSYVYVQVISYLCLCLKFLCFFFIVVHVSNKSLWSSTWAFLPTVLLNLEPRPWPSKAITVQWSIMQTLTIHWFLILLSFGILQFFFIRDFSVKFCHLLYRPRFSRHSWWHFSVLLFLYVFTLLLSFTLPFVVPP